MDKNCKLTQVCKADWDLLAIDVENARLERIEEKRRAEESPIKSQAPSSATSISLNDSGSDSGNDSGVSV